MLGDECYGPSTALCVVGSSEEVQITHLDSRVSEMGRVQETFSCGLVGPKSKSGK